MTLRAHHLVVSLFTGAVFFSSLAIFAVDSPNAQAACATGSYVTITNPSTSTSSGAMSGIVNLTAQATPTTASGMNFMLLNPAQQTIGAATQSGSTWTLSWDTRNQPNGPNQLIAIAHFGGATSLDCASAVVPIAINNVATQNPRLIPSITPNTWQGSVGASAPFGIDAVYTDQYGRSSHVTPSGVNWHSNIGAIAPNNGSSTVFTAGAVVATGSLIADVSYQGLVAPAQAQIKVVASSTSATNPTPTPTPSPTVSPTNTDSKTDTSPGPTPAPLSASDAARLSSMPTIFRPSAPTNSDPVVSLPTLSCLEKAVGTVRFSEISSGKSQPTAAERKLAAACFSGAEAIPAVLAPVAPSNLTDLNTTTDIVSVGSIQNQFVSSADGKKINGLLLSGRGSPNSNIFIYVFSDPLVLRAETNSQGIWSYVLETPLKSGKHEVYAVAEKDAGNFVRTSAVPISIASAAPGSQDGRLVVERSLSTAQIGFVAGAVAMVVAAIIVLFSILRRRRPLAASIPVAQTAPEPVSIAPDPTPLTTPTLEEPVLAPAPTTPDSAQAPSGEIDLPVNESQV